MRRLAVVAGAVALLAIAYVGLKAGGWIVPAQTGRMTAMAEADYLVITTLEELTQEASVVAVGTVAGVDGTRNVARDPWNPELPHPSLEIIAVDYRFEVEEFLKGSAPSTLLVTESKWIGRKGQPRALIRGFVEMSSGGRYVVFLRETTDETGHWIGIAEPWRFALRDGQAVVESRWEAAGDRFPAIGEEEFLAQVRAFVDTH